MSQGVKRKVHFFRAYRGLNEAGEPLPFDANAALEVIGRLEFQSGENYMDESDGNVLCSWVDRLGRSFPRARVARVRRSALPQVEVTGVLNPLNIPATSGLAETVHLVFFPDNVVGFLYNHFGPRIRRIGLYFQEKGGEVSNNVRFDHLLMPDVLNKLDDMKSVRMIRLRLRRSVVEEKAKMDESVRTLLQGAIGLGDAERIEIILTPEPYSKDDLGSRAQAKVRRLAGRDDISAIADKFVVEGETEGGVEPLDLLSAHIVSEQTVVQLDERTRALSDASAYSAIETAHKQLREQIHRAASIWVPRD